MSQATRILGCNPLTARYVYSCISFNLNSVFEQSLRWKRKPIWLPTAKSKVFRVPQRPVVTEEESVEMKRLFNNYRTVVKSLRRHFIRIAEENKVELDPVIIEKAKEDDFLSCSAINDKWNEEISLDREARRVIEKEQREEMILKAIERNAQKKEKRLEQAVKEINEAQKLIPTFITSSNIDEAIEEALNNVIDYNYAIDADGRKYSSSEMDSIEKHILAEKEAQVSQ